MNPEQLLLAAKHRRIQLASLIRQVLAIESALVSADTVEGERLGNKLRAAQKKRGQVETRLEQVLREMVQRLPQEESVLRARLRQLTESYHRLAARPAALRAAADEERLQAVLGELQQLGQAIDTLAAEAHEIVEKLQPPLIPYAAVLERIFKRLVALRQRIQQCEATYEEITSPSDPGNGPALPPGRAVAAPTRHIVLPYTRNPAFTGRRKELRRLDQAMGLATARLGETIITASPSPIFVTGLPGVGKTQLALEYAYHRMTAFQVILWVNAEGENISSSIAKVVREFLPSSPLEPDEVVARRLLKHLEQGGPHLLILDNVTNPKSYQEFLPRLGQTRVLITSRRRDLFQYALDKKRDQRVGVLALRAALRLLLGSKRLEDEEQAAAAELCAELGYLPLALAIASQALQVTEDSPTALLGAIRGQGPTLWADQVASYSDLEEEGRHFIRSYPSLSRLFDATYSLVSRYCPHAELVAQCAGFFASVSIDRPLLLEAANELAVASGAPLQSTEQSKQALGWLLRLGLAEAAGPKGVTFHWLVQDYLRHKGGHRAKKAVLATLAQKVQRVYEGGLTPLNLLTLVPDRKHIEQADRLIGEADAQSSYWITIGLLWVRTLCGEFGAVLQRCTEALPLVKDPYLEAWLWHQRGWVLLPLGRYREALACLRRAFAIRRRLERTTKLELCYELQDIARAQIALGQYASARRSLLYAQRCLQALHDQKLGQLGEALILHQLGRVAFFLGRCAEAEKYFYTSLSIKRQYNSTSDALYANTLHALGELHCATGAYEQALEEFDHALRIRRQLSVDHPDILSTQEGIAQVYLRQGRLTEAATAFRETGTQRERILGQNHPDLASNLEGYGRVLMAQNQLRQAWSVLRRAYLIRRRALGSSHPVLVASYEALAECALGLGELRRGQALIRRALQVRPAAREGSAFVRGLDSAICVWSRAAESLRVSLVERDGSGLQAGADLVLECCREALGFYRLLGHASPDPPAPVGVLATAILRYRDRNSLSLLAERCSLALGGQHSLVLWLLRRCEGAES